MLCAFYHNVKKEGMFSFLLRYVEVKSLLLCWGIWGTPGAPVALD